MKVPEGFEDKRICIIGLGYVGLTLAVAMCDVGFQVHGVERNPHVLDCLSAGKAHFLERGLDERVAKHVNSGHFSFGAKIKPDDHRRVYIITVGTPLTSEKQTNLSAIQSVARDVAEVLKPGELIMLRSTVRIGVTRDVVKPLLDSRDIPYALAFCPERTLEGKAIEELTSLPQIVGGVDNGSTIRAKNIFGFLTPTVITVSSLEAAEMVKLVNNTQRDYMFAFANEVAEICDVCSVSAIEVIRAGALNYPRAFNILPGPVGGPCLEKDPYILTEGVVQKGGQEGLALRARHFNEAMPSRSAALIASHRRGSNSATKKIVIFGLAFKGRPETSDLRGSMAYPLIKHLQAHFPDAVIGGFDPSTDPEETKSFKIEIFDNAESAATDTDVIFFQTNNPRFQELNLTRLSGLMRNGALIYDYWNQFKDVNLNEGRSYAGLGTWLTANPPSSLGNKKRTASAPAYAGSVEIV